MQLLEETLAELNTLRSLIAIIPEENVIDKASLEARIRVVIEKALLKAAHGVCL